MNKQGLKNRWYIISIFFSLLPLLTGCSFYGIWRVTHDMGLAFTGLLLTPLCLLSLIISFISLFPAAAHYKESNAPYRKRKILLALALILINFPVAGTIVSEADYYYSLSAVVVRNNSDTSIADLVITDPQGNILSIPPVASHSEKTHRLPFKGEGKVSYKLTSSAGLQEGVLIGFISVPIMTLGGIIEINPDGSVKADEIDRALSGPF